MSKHVWDDKNTDAKCDEETLGSSERQSFFFFFFSLKSLFVSPTWVKQMQF